MPLITFADARPYARSIRSNVVSRTMPPWFADPHYGTFRNDRSLSQHDIDTIVAWVDAGTPEGNAADMPKRPEFASGWQISQPDAVFEMPADFQIPATGTLDYRSFNVPTNFTQDMWVVAAEVRVEDRAHVHHAVVTIQEPGGNKSLGALQVHADSAERRGARGPHAAGTGGEAADRSEPLGEHRASARRIRRRRAAARLARRPRQARAGRIDAELLDALHDQRHARERSDEDRPRPREDAAEGRDLHGPDQQRPVRNPAGRRRTRWWNPRARSCRT